MMSEKEDNEEEEKQFKKIKFPLSDSTRFRKTRRELLEEHPELMSGVPKEMRWSPDKSVERSKWEETTKRWREELEPQRSRTVVRNRGMLKKILFGFAIGFLIFIVLYLFIPELQSYFNALITHL